MYSPSTDWQNSLVENNNNNNSTVALSLQQIANSTSQILGCLISNPSFQNKTDATKRQRPKPYEVPTSSKTHRNVSRVN